MADRVKLECVKGNIVEQPDLEAVVNAANAQLLIGGGVAGAIHRAAGPELEKACRPLAPIKPGQAVLTDAFDLPNRKIVHCLVPVYNIDKPSDQLLADGYRNSLLLADEHGLKSIGFPAVSTGAFGYPIEEAAEVTADAVHSTMKELTNITLIRFVLYSDNDREVFCRAMALDT